MAFLGPDYLINSTTGGDQADPTQTVLADGRILVTWTSYEGAPTDTDGYPDDVRGRILNPDGSAGSPDFVVNTTTDGNQGGATVTALPDGSAFVAWSSFDPSSGEGEIRARIVHADGGSGDEFTVNSPTTNVEFGVSTTALADGKILVAWATGYDDEGNPSDIVGRVLNGDGTAAAPEFIINSTVAGLQYGPVMTSLPDGDAFVTWVSSDDQRTGNYVIYGRMLNADGTSSAPDFQINTTTSFYQIDPTVTTLADGSVFVTWDSGTDVRGRIYHADGTAAGADFLIGSPVDSGGISARSSVTALPDGHAFVVWDTYDIATGYDVYGRVVNADGTMSAAELIVNSAVGLGESNPHVTELPNGELFVTWTSYDPATNDQDIHGRILSLDSSVNGTPGNDVIEGGAGNDIIHGGDGNDLVLGGGGNDTLYGDAGHNLLWGNGGNDTFVGGIGTDSFAGGAGIDTVRYDTSSAGVTVDLTSNTASGGAANGDTFNSIENLTGSVLNDSLTGDSAGNHLVGGAGNDRIWGGSGNDTLDGGAGADNLAGGTGIDTVDYSASSLAVNVNLALGVGHGGDAEGDTLSAIENVVGTAFNDVLTGSNIANHLSGGSGNDILVGGLGSDVLAGGSGADSFVFKTALDSAPGHEDQITDFSSGEGDRIDLSTIDANTNAAGLQAFVYIGATAFTGAAGEVHYVNHFLEADLDGNGTADIRIHVNADHLTVGDLIV